MANTKISQLPSWTGTAADLRWFVMNNSGQTETFKFSGYTSPFTNGSGSYSIIPTYLTPDKALGDYSFVVGQTNYISSTGTNNAVIGGLNNRVTENNQNFVGGGESNSVAGGKNSATIGGNTLVAYGENCFVGGGQSSNAVGVNSITLGGLRQTAGNSYSAYLICGLDNTYQAGGDGGNGILGGTDNAMAANGGKGISIIGGTQNKYLSAPTLGGNFEKSSGSIIGGNSNRIEGPTTNANGEHAFPLIFGGSSNKIFGETTSATSGATIINSFSSTITSSSGSTILGGTSNNISSSSSGSTIIGGNNNTLDDATNGSIINSKNTNQNVGSAYVTDTVTMIGCENTSATNMTNSVILAVSGKTISGNNNTTYVDKLFVFGNATYEATTFTNSGTCLIDIFNMSHVIIIATGGTYTLEISPTPSTNGTPEVTILFNISGGASIVFEGGGNTQWYWGNGAGTPVFTNNTKSIIKMASWEGNDVYEISRSMNMV